MDPQEPTGRADAWPPPHPSPPPRPHEYGAPGASRDRGWVWAVLGGLVAVALFAGGGVWMLSGSGGDEPATAANQPTSTSASPSAPEPASPSAVAETSPPPPQALCWDGSTAQTVEQCSMPDGAAGLAWLFPQVTGQQCRPPAQNGPGVVIRVLCSATLPDGTKVQLGFYQWESVSAGVAYYDAQGLRRNDREGFHAWAARLGQRTKKAVLYTDAPYSRTMVFRSSAAGSPELLHLQPRRPGQVRGEPVG